MICKNNFLLTGILKKMYISCGTKTIYASYKMTATVRKTNRSKMGSKCYENHISVFKFKKFLELVVKKKELLQITTIECCKLLYKML